jgi:hypothetical protein
MKVKELVEKLQKLDPEYSLVQKNETGFNVVFEVREIRLRVVGNAGLAYIHHDYEQDINGKYVAYELVSKSVKSKGML